jgi:hypothetical protein
MTIRDGEVTGSHVSEANALEPGEVVELRLLLPCDVFSELELVAGAKGVTIALLLRLLLLKWHEFGNYR